MTTKADQCKEFELSLLAFDYQLGAEGTDTDHDGRKEIDCSGNFHQMNHHVGFTDVPDDTAAGYYDRMKPRTGPPQPGDAGFLKDGSGHVHHMCVALGDGTEVEARTAHAPVGHQVQHRPIHDFEVEAGFAGWRYWPGHDFGRLTVQATTYTIVLVHTNTADAQALVKQQGARGKAAVYASVPKDAYLRIRRHAALIHAYENDTVARAAMDAAVK